MADYFGKSGLADPYLIFVREQSQFPPLYPLFLSLFGAGSESQELASAITILCLLFSFIIFALFVY